MPLSWNEIRARAASFSEEWKDAHYEKGDTHSFYNDFFNVFGQKRRSVAVYEEKVKKLNDKQGFIDLFWPGTLLVEQKSAGRSLRKAREQATDYFLALKENEKPRYILLSDFQTFEFLDLEENTKRYFTLSEFPEKIKLFDFIAGYQQQKYEEQHPANIKASELMSDLHKQLEKSGYVGNDLERLLVRIMFSLFADDTGIFERDIFLRYIENNTKEDGADLGSHLIHLFQTMDTPLDKRQKTLNEDLTEFPYVNGELFKDTIRTPSFNSGMRDSLLECCYFDWRKVSPALFGSLFQTVMLPEEQRQGGAHYTSEKNILKTIRPLFMDELRDEFEKIKKYSSAHKKSTLKKFHEKISKLTFLDPACGCGNFLILAYRELRQLEIEVLEELNPKFKDGSRKGLLNIDQLSKMDVDQFYGIEIEEFPSRVAETAMWLVDHQMNMRLSDAFGQVFVRLPLQQSAHIFHGNALKTDWNTVLPAKNCSYILGNPPFVGSKLMTNEQRNELLLVFKDTKGAGTLDYVTAWYGKAARYIQGTNIKVAFVSTNSICQGEQVGILWGELLNKYGIEIQFAHQTFKWTIDEKKAKGMRIAAVFVIIIGFASRDADIKYLFEYDTLKSDPHISKVNNINPYLVDGPDTMPQKRSKPLCDVPEIGIGNKPVDDGNYLFTPERKKAFLKKEPFSEEFFFPWLGSREFLNGVERWCLWLGDCPPGKLKTMPHALELIENVRKFRLKSDSIPTQKIADTPRNFHVENIPQKSYLIIPKVSSERRAYIPIGFMNPNTLASDLVFIVQNAKKFHFGILSSEMHMAWVRYVSGRLKSDFRYSKDLVYNNYPWPEVSNKQKQNIEEKAQAVLDARSKFLNSTLADLYDPNTMPPTLLRAHQTLDKAVDQAYRKSGFENDKERIEFLFKLYQQITEPLIAKIKKTRKK